MKLRCQIAIAVGAITMSLAAQSAAFAHAELKQATPSVNGTVNLAPNEVTLKFSERLEPAFSTVVVRNATGKRMDKANAKIDTKDRTVMRTSLPPLDPGIYIVEWRALTVDTHRTEGAFIFRVGE
jgi:hypothetical protein